MDSYPDNDRNYVETRSSNNSIIFYADQRGQAGQIEVVVPMKGERTITIRQYPNTAEEGSRGLDLSVLTMQQLDDLIRLQERTDGPFTYLGFGPTQGVLEVVEDLTLLWQRIFDVTEAFCPNMRSIIESAQWAESEESGRVLVTPTWGDHAAAAVKGTVAMGFFGSEEQALDACFRFVPSPEWDPPRPTATFAGPQVRMTPRSNVPRGGFVSIVSDENVASGAEYEFGRVIFDARSMRYTIVPLTDTIKTT